MDFDPEIKQPSAFADVNEKYDQQLAARKDMGGSEKNAVDMAKISADKTGGDELQEYIHSEALKDIQDIANRQYTPTTLKQTNEVLGFKRPDFDISGRYDDEGQELVIKMIAKAQEMKRLYEEDISNASDWEVAQRIITLLEKKLFTPDELNAFCIARDQRQAMQAKTTLKNEILAQPDINTRNKKIDLAVSTNQMSIAEAAKFREAHGLIIQE